MTVIEIIRLVGKEFSGISDEDIEEWIALTTPLVNKKMFGNLYDQAVAYLVCHRLKMNGDGDNALGDMGKISTSFGIGSVSDGGTSISFNTGNVSSLATDVEYSLTSYGIQYLGLRKKCVVPIAINGGDWIG